MRFQAHVLAVTCFCLVCSSVSAQVTRPPQQSTTNPVAFYSPGSSSCGAWLDAREGEKKGPSDVRHLQFEAFLLGFASAYNLYVGDAPSPRGILGETDAYSQWAYLDKYCRDKPTDAFFRAVLDLLNHLRSLQR